MLAIDGAGFDWSFMADKEFPTDMALMAFSDSKAHNDKTCSKTCLKSFETLKTQHDDLFSQVTPKVSHLHAVKRIFRYLKGQPKLGLWYPKDSPFYLEAYTNSDYASASLQTIVANSTTEAEYVATASCCRQVLWIENQMLDYGYWFV
ncbi:hypothetical protein Tco_0253982 [Tanacetum coccineum]